MKNWYILNVPKGSENIVKKDIETMLKQKNLQNKIEHIVIPINNKKINLNTPFTKKNSLGYLFIKLEYSTNLLVLIEKTSKKSRFLLKNKQPIVIDNDEIKKLLNKLSFDNQYFQKSNIYTTGETIRINKGPFFDYTGKIIYIDYKKNKIRVEIVVFGRKAIIELKFNQIEKE